MESGSYILKVPQTMFTYMVFQIKCSKERGNSSTRLQNDDSRLRYFIIKPLCLTHATCLSLDNHQATHCNNLKHSEQGNQRWQIPRPATCQCLAMFTPLKSKILIFFRDVISLLARVFILLIDAATQEVSMKYI